MQDVYAHTIQLGLPAQDNKTCLELVGDALREWIGARWPGDRDWFSAEDPATFKSSDGDIFRWEPFLHGDTTFLDFTWRHPDAQDSNVSWSTRVTFLDDPRERTLSIRISNLRRDEQGGSIYTTRPRLIVCLLNRFPCTVDGVRCTGKPRKLNSQGLVDIAKYELCDPERNHPTLLLTPDDEGNYVITPDRLGYEFLTLGTLYVAESPESTYALTRELQRKELSCFHGALRAYMPGFNRYADPTRHPLLLARRLDDPRNRIRLAQALAAATARRYREPARIKALRDDRAVAYEAARAQTVASLRSRAEAARTAADWEELADNYARENDELREQLQSKEEELRDARQRGESLQVALRHALQRVPAAPESEAAPLEPESTAEAVETAQALFEEDLLILPSALDAAIESPFGRPADVLNTLRVAAGISRRRRSGPLGKALKDAFSEAGVDYRQGIARTTSRKLRGQYRFTHDNRTYVCEEHLCLGGGTYDPVACLRIYLTSDPPEEEDRLVIGHVGRHLDVQTTT